MKISKIEVKNFRSLRSIEILPEDVLALVGRNNSGKSNVIRALELFFEGSIRLVDDECFHDHKTDSQIEIFVTFEQLSNWEKDKFEPWMYGEKLIVGRRFACEGQAKYNMDTLARIRIPGPEWLQEGSINGKRIAEWWSKKDDLKSNGLDFGATLGTSKPTVGAWKEAAKKFLVKNGDKLTWKEELVENPKGYPGVLKGALPEFVLVPAVRDVSEETKVTKSSPFGQLIHSVLAKVSEMQKESISEDLRRIEAKLNRSEENGRIEEIKKVERRLNELMSDLMECDLEIEMSMPSLDDVFGRAKVYANDGVRTAIDTKGHGMQRSVILTILRAYAELKCLEKAGENANERSTIFAIEEPELYLHPHSQRILMSVFQEIASEGDQVIFSTQSSLFVEISLFDQICILRRVKEDEGYESHPTQLPMSAMIDDLKARKGVDATEEGIREQYSHVFNPVINEGFFADKVVVVEGPSEQYSLPIYAETLGFNLNRYNISVVHSGGKGQMDRLFRVFTGFKIPTYLWFDGDRTRGDKESKDKTLELLKLVGDPVERIEEVETKVGSNYAIIEEKLEILLKDELAEYDDIMQEAAGVLGPAGKPLKHRFIANWLKKQVSEGAVADKRLPKTIVDIVRSIQDF